MKEITETHPISLTIFDSKYDNTTNKRVDLDSWQDFVNLLEKLSKIPRAGKKDAQLFSPAVYSEGEKRRNVNVVEWAGWAAIDIDEHVPQGGIEDDIRNRFGDYSYVCYSTASSSVDKPKFRLAFPLTEAVSADRIRHLWFALNTEAGELGDRQCKDLSRMYYIPGRYDGAYNFIFVNDGVSIDVEHLLKKYPYEERRHATSFMDRLPDEMKAKVIEYRKSQLNNHFEWTSYQNCPFVSKRQIAEYKSITGGGWYAKMYSIMVSIASTALKRGYPITAQEIADLCTELDNETGRWYENRPILVEADRALEYAYRKT